MTIQETLSLASRRIGAGKLAEAGELCRQVLARQANQPDALHLLGIVAFQSGQAQAALELIQKAIAINGRSGDMYCNLGLVLAGLGRAQEAVAAYEKSLTLDPLAYETQYNLGNALCDLGRPADAVAVYQRALAMRPKHAGALANMGSALRALGRLPESIAALQEAISVEPSNFQAHNNLGNALRESGALDEAIRCFRAAATLRPNHPVAFSNIGNAMLARGDIAAAIASYDRSLALNPQAPAIASNRLFALQFHGDYDAAAILQENRLWNERYAEPLRYVIRPHENERSAERRLRVGYISPDFVAHCQALFMTPLLARHDHEGFDIYCYADVRKADGVTERLRGYADVWRSTAGMSDEAVAELIRGDRIDILVDLTMHMARCRPLVMARKPAPVQVAYLAYPGTTGLAAMDYRLTDPYLDPPGEHDDWYAEKSVRLPETFWCYDPRGMHAGDEELPEPGGLAAGRNGRVTFGCLNNFCKINEQTVELWSRVMLAVARSRLVLLAPEGEARKWAAEQFGRRGIEAGRLDFVANQARFNYLAEYQRIDIGLDTLPYNGHTTSLDALWMGVPVVSRVGATVVGRAGFSQLSNLKLTELAGWGDDEFVNIATELASDIPRLSELRRTLRERMMGSALMEAKKFVIGVEGAYRGMWNAYVVQV